MKREMTFAQYRVLDLGMLAAVLLFSENVIHWAIRLFPNELYTASVVAAVTAIVLMRWGGYAGIHALLGGALFCALSGGSGRHYLIYCAGNLLSLAALLLFKLWDRERVRTDSTRSMVFAGTVQVLMWAGRFLLALLLGNPPEVCLGFVTTDALSLVFTLAIIWVARRLDGIFEDQKHYLLRLHGAGREEEGGSQ